LQKNVLLNTKDSRISASKLEWGFSVKSDIKYDFIFAADCLFCAPLHREFLYTIKELMAKNGKCILLAPERKKTLTEFIKTLEKTVEFNYTITDKIDEGEIQEKLEKIKKNPFYIADQHKPYLITLTLK